MLDLDQAIKERHSTRMFLPKPVPLELVDEAVALAQLAPSNSNIQPWHVVFVSGPPRDRLVAAHFQKMFLVCMDAAIPTLAGDWKQAHVKSPNRIAFHPGNENASNSCE